MNIKILLLLTLVINSQLIITKTQILRRNKFNSNDETENLINTFLSTNRRIDFDFIADILDGVSSNACFTFLVENGKKYDTIFSAWQGVSVNFKIKNSCPESSPIDNLPFTISGFSINGDVSQSPNNQISTNPWLISSNITFDKKGNVVFKVSTMSIIDSWAFIPSNGTVSIQFIAWPDVGVTSFKIDDLNIGENVKTGKLKVQVDSTKLSQLCASITCVIETLVSYNTNVVQSFKINPNVDPKPIVTIQLNPGVYKLAPNKATVPNDQITFSFNPKDEVEVKADSETVVNMNINYAGHYGNLNLSIQTIDNFGYISDISGKLQGKTNNVVVNFSLSLGKAINIPNMIVDSYIISLQGVADVSKGTFYTFKGLEVKLIENQTVNTVLQYTLVNSLTFSSNFNVNYNGYNQNVNVNFKSNSYKYLNMILKSQTYKFLEENVNVTIDTPQGYIVSTQPNPLIINKTVQNVQITFEKNTVAKVPGWPNFIAMGTITINGGLSEGKGRPFDALFKYSGDNGAGDLGIIMFPAATFGTKKWAEKYSSINNHLVKPVMVHYSLQLSGGSTTVDLEGTNVSKHFINLAHDALLLNEPFTYNNVQVYGSIILNPDALGFIMQNNLYGGSGYDDLKNRVIPVNTSLAQMFCFLKTKINYKNYSGTPLEVAKITNQTWIDPLWNQNAETWLKKCLNSKKDPVIPSFNDDFKGWILANNWIITYFGPKVTFGWHMNISMLPAGSIWILKNNYYNFNNAKNIQDTVSTPTINFLNMLEVNSKIYTPHFLVFDRYEVDDSQNISYYFYNDSCWYNLLLLVGQVSKGMNNVPIMLWQMPGGHIQVEGDIDQRNGHGGAFGNFLFGDPKLKKDLSNVRGYWKNLGNVNWCKTGGQACSVLDYLKENSYDWSADNGNLALAAKNNVFSILFGGGTGPTTGINVFPTDDGGWLSNNIVSYYNKIQAKK